MLDRRRVKRDEEGGLGEVSYTPGVCGKGVRMVSLGCDRYFIPNSGVKKDQGLIASAILSFVEKWD